MVKASVTDDSGFPVVSFQFGIPPEHVLYPERLHFQDEAGNDLPVLRIPEPVTAIDKVTHHEKKLYDKSFAAELKLSTAAPMDLVVKFQGCSNDACYFPDKRLFRVNPDGSISERSLAPVAVPVAANAVNDPPAGWTSELRHFRVAARRTGYVPAGEFTTFLQRAAKGAADVEEPLGRFKNTGLIATMVLIIIGGLGLNLTPCVLPLIPINLAIIGAGKKAKTRLEGFLNGATYGAGMALAYGLLGVVVVLTGAKFGALNSSVWFNILIAIVFIALSLAMFGRLNLDFSTYEGGLGRKLRALKSQSLLAFGMGGIAALLAGACVAPVVISVLLLSANFYARGVLAGVLLPLLLGIGMALPWPFAGASLSCLPKPGQWMVWVKKGFGAVILLFAFYYAHLAFGLYRTAHSTVSLASMPAGASSGASSADDSLAAAMKMAREQGKPLLVDFHASWCKNCVAMEETVFTRPIVQKALAEFVLLRYAAERPNESPAREVLDRLGIMGLPACVVLLPDVARSANLTLNNDSQPNR